MSKREWKIVCMEFRMYIPGKCAGCFSTDSNLYMISTQWRCIISFYSPQNQVRDVHSLDLLSIAYMPRALQSTWVTVSEQDKPCSRETYVPWGMGGAVTKRISKQRNEWDNSESGDCYKYNSSSTGLAGWCSLLVRGFSHHVKSFGLIEGPHDLAAGLPQMGVITDRARQTLPCLLWPGFRSHTLMILQYSILASLFRVGGNP